MSENLNLGKDEHVCDESAEWEYKVIKGSPSEVQMKLNQWRHQFKVRIKYVTPPSLDDSILVVLVRKRR